MHRRRFLQSTAAGTLASLRSTPATGAALPPVTLVVDPADPIANAAPVQWAVEELARCLKTYAGLAVNRVRAVPEASPGSTCVVVAGASMPVARSLVQKLTSPMPAVPEALALIPFGDRSLLATANDARGLVFAILDLSDRTTNGAPLIAAHPIVEKPFNRVRSFTRLFTSDVEDKPWFNDRGMWPAYLTMLAAQRFNRFNLALGIGYDFIRQVTDSYFLFPYPFFLGLPDYPGVRAVELPDAERDANLQMLRYISEQTVARGLQFQLGLWMHGYEWIDTKHANYNIAGLNKSNHGPYCRDAVRALLQACPAISGVTFRVHGESGVEEGSYQFWKTVFDGVATCGRTVEIDMHAKGMDETMQKLAAATGQPVKISPKYWAEHMGLPYHQADIREQEQPKPGKVTEGLMKFSAGSRSFLRYGYGDLLREDRPYGVLHRIWPGTQRLLLWGDPLTAAAHSRAFAFCGSDGVEIMEPLSFKGRRGSGLAGDRCAYLDASLKPRWDWQKYEYGTRLWGRFLYNPAAGPDAWRPYLQKQFGPAALPMENALANASRILPLITTAHDPSAANNNYWPEIYLNQSLIDAAHFEPYRDTPAPRVFGNVSPLDPQLFLTINQHADHLLSGELSGKYTPIEVAQWLSGYAAQASLQLAEAGKSAGAGVKRSPGYRRAAIDVEIQAGLGRFFAAKFRSAVLYRIFEQTGDADAHGASLEKYREARAAWAAVAALAEPVYQADITVGELPQLRGHWADRLAAIDNDIALVAAQRSTAARLAASTSPTMTKAAIQAALGRPSVRPSVAITHQPPASFTPGQPVELRLTVAASDVTARLLFRRVTQAERFRSAVMEGKDGRYRAAIPAGYTESPYPLEYYFELTRAPSRAWLYPGFAADLNNQPYFVIRRA